MEALCPARYEFPGRQKAISSKRCGFKNVDRKRYQRLKAEKRVPICIDGAYVRYIS